MGGRYVAIALLAACASAHASFHTFQVNEIYSSPDGLVQFVELRESVGSPFENFLGGHRLRSVQGGIVRDYFFPNDLPAGSTANRYVLIATPGFAGVAGVTPDYVVPAPFLFPGGGTLNYADVDIVTYVALPADGRSSLDRNDNVAPATPTNFAGQVGNLAPPPPPPAPATEVPALDGWTHAALVLMLLGLGGTLARLRTATSRRGGRRLRDAHVAPRVRR